MWSAGADPLPKLLVHVDVCFKVETLVMLAPLPLDGSLDLKQRVITNEIYFEV